MNNRKGGIRQAIHAHMDSLPPMERKIAEFTLSNYRDCGMLGIGELARQCEVSNATVNRYAHSLGFEGYQDYIAHLREELRSKSSLEHLRASVREGNPADLLKLSLFEDLDQLQRLTDSIDPNAFREATELLLKARRIFVLGQGSSQFFAGYLAFNLQGLGLDVTLMGADSGIEGIARKSLSIGEKDVMVCIAFPRFSSLTFEMAQVAEKTGCRIVIISSSLTSQLARLGDITLCAPNRRDLHSGSGVSAVSVCEALITALTSLASNAEEAAGKLAPIIDHHLLS